MIKETNVDFAYAMLPGHDGKALLAMHVEHYDLATSILNYRGFRLLYEEDLVRRNSLPEDADKAYQDE
jgi:hypothetical protein